jgi:hypothetical protein
MRPLPSSVRSSLERVFSGPKPQDPLYVTHRSGLRKLGLAMLVAAPVMLFLLLMVLFSAGLIPVPRSASLADAGGNPPIDPGAATDLEVLELALERTPLSITGAVRNRSDRRYNSVHIGLYVLDSSGSRVGSSEARLEEVAPKAVVRFRAPLSEPRAHSVLVREVWGF